MSQPVYIYRMARTAIGQTNGIHKNTLPEVLMAQVLTHLLTAPGTPTAELSHAIDDCLLASAVGPMGNPARLAWLTAGLPLAGSAATVDFQCGGSLKALSLAYAQIAAGIASAVVAGGMESTSLEPTRIYHPRDPRKAQVPGPLPRAQFAPESLGDVDMLTGAENTADRYRFTREALDTYALLSHQRALATAKSGVLAPYILPLANASESSADESLRPSISLRLLGRAKPLLGPGGLTTAGNACLMHDGAAALLLGSADFGARFGLEPLAELLCFATVGVEPTFSPLGATEALLKLSKSQGIPLEDLEHIEINEAFAAKVLAFNAITGIDLDRVNPMGGALAFGHPYAASGAIYTLHLIAGLKSRGGGLGAVSLGVAGGQGIAALLRVPGDFNAPERS